MRYTDTYRNTFFVDVLEYFNRTKACHDMDMANPCAKTVKGNDYDLEGSPSEHASSRSGANSGSSSGNENIAIAVEQVKEQPELIPEDEEVEEKEKETEKDPFLVEYSGPDDPEHPQNWCLTKKSLVVTQVMLLTCVTYMGSSIYTPGQEQIQEEFHVGHVVGTLNLSLYVLGYGLGPIIFSPLSEFAKIGRQRLYIITLFGFAMLQIGCATVQNIVGLIIIRFITGVLCSPSLSTGGATIGDVITPMYVPLFIGLWSIGAVASPIIGPLVGASMVVAKNWRYIFWLMLWLSSLTLIILIFFFPETNPDNILYRRALRIRKITGDDRYYTEKARSEDKLSMKEIASIALYRPFKIIIKEPIVLAIDLYIALCYGTFYLFFEAFPIVFIGIYNFTLIEVGLAYMGFCVGCVIAYALCVVFLIKVVGKKAANGTFTPETFMLLAMAVCWTLPLSLFLFGWAASVHWIVPIIAEAFFIICVFNLFQATFAYLAMSYPKYLASVYAGNGVCRGGFACAFPLFGKAMYDNLAIKGYPVAWGSSILGFFSIGLAIIPFLLYKYGPYLRSKSSYTG